MVLTSDGRDADIQRRVPLRQSALRGDDRSRSGHRLQLLTLLEEGLPLDLRDARALFAPVRRTRGGGLPVQPKGDPPSLLLDVRRAVLRTRYDARWAIDGFDQC